MAEDKDEVPETEQSEEEAAEETEVDAAAQRQGPRGPDSVLTRASDHAVRPGFRNAPNQRTKAQKKKARKKR